MASSEATHFLGSLRRLSRTPLKPLGACKRDMLSERLRHEDSNFHSLLIINYRTGRSYLLLNFIELQCLVRRKSSEFLARGSEWKLTSKIDRQRTVTNLLLQVLNCSSFMHITCAASGICKTDCKIYDTH